MFVNGYFGYLIPVGTGGGSPPASPSQVNGQANVYDEHGSAENGVKIYSQMYLPPPLMGNVYDSAIKESISAAGLVTITGLFKGAVYAFWGGRSDRYYHRIPSDATHPYSLPPILRNDSLDPCIT